MASSEEGDERGEVHVASSEAAREAASDGGASLAAARSGRRRRCATFRAATPDGSARSRAPPDDAAASGSSSSADSDPLMRLDFSRYARWSSPRRSAAAASPRGAFVCRGAPRPRGVRDEDARARRRRRRSTRRGGRRSRRRASPRRTRGALSARVRVRAVALGGPLLRRAGCARLALRAPTAHPRRRLRPARASSLGRPPAAARAPNRERDATRDGGRPAGVREARRRSEARGGDARRGGEGGRHPSAPNVRGEK